MEAQQSQVLHRFIDFYWQGPSPTICPGTAFEASSGFPNSGSTILFPECLSPWGTGGSLHSGSSGTRLLWKSLRMWFSITCCTGNRKRRAMNGIGAAEAPDPPASSLHGLSWGVLP